MNAEEILSDIQLIDLTHRDAQYVRAELIEKIDAAIAAAVQAEREACAAIVKDHLYLPEHGYIETCEDMTDELAAAIRARNGRYDANSA